MRRVLILAMVALIGIGCSGRPASPVSSPAASSLAAPTPEAPETPPPTSTARPTVAPTDSPSPQPAFEFERVADVEDAELYSIISFAGGFVAAGCHLASPAEKTEGGCTDALALYSADGRTWVETEISNGTNRRVYGLASTPFGVLLFGSTLGSEPPLDRVLWRSNDGRRWVPFDIPAPRSILFHEAVVVDGRTVLLGADSAYDFSTETEAWSTDGTTWKRGTTPISPKIAAYPGLVAIGDECVDLCPDDARTHVFRSVDGLRWTEDAPDQAIVGAQIFATGTWQGRVVVGGSAGNGAASAATIWIDRPDGWQAVPLDGGAGLIVEAVLDLDGRLAVVARAERDGPAHAWSSADGVTWDQVSVGAFPDGFVAGWAGRDPIVLLVGYRSIWATLP